MYRFTISVLLIAVATTNVIAFPQNGLNADVSSQADGFIFDGPVDRIRPTSSTSPSRTAGTTERTLTTRATPASTTQGSQAYGRCFSTCLSTAEYNPVCGTDNISYDNPGRLSCASTCGKNVELNFYGRCSGDGLG